MRYTFPLTESLLYVSSRNIPIYPFFLRSRTPHFATRALCFSYRPFLSLILPPSLFFSILNPRFIPSRLFVFTPIKSCSFFALESPNPNLLSSFFSFRRLSILLLLPLPSHHRYVSTYYLRQFPHRANQPMISLAFHKSRPISDERFLLWIFKSFLCVHTFSTCTYEALYRDATIRSVCARMNLVLRRERVWCVSSTCIYIYINVCTNRVNDNFLQSGSKNLLNWQFKRYIRYNGFMEVINGNLVYLSWNN